MPKYKLHKQLLPSTDGSVPKKSSKKIVVNWKSLDDDFKKPDKQNMQNLFTQYVQSGKANFVVLEKAYPSILDSEQINTKSSERRELKDVFKKQRLPYESPEYELEWKSSLEDVSLEKGKIYASYDFRGRLVISGKIMTSKGLKEFQKLDTGLYFSDQRAAKICVKDNKYQIFSQLAILTDLQAGLAPLSAMTCEINFRVDRRPIQEIAEAGGFFAWIQSYTKGKDTANKTKDDLNSPNWSSKKRLEKRILNFDNHQVDSSNAIVSVSESPKIAAFWEVSKDGYVYLYAVRNIGAIQLEKTVNLIHHPHEKERSVPGGIDFSNLVGFVRYKPKPPGGWLQKILHYILSFFGYESKLPNRGIKKSTNKEVYFSDYWSEKMGDDEKKALFAHLNGDVPSDVIRQHEVYNEEIAFGKEREERLFFAEDKPCKTLKNNEEQFYKKLRQSDRGDHEKILLPMAQEGFFQQSASKKNHSVHKTEDSEEMNAAANKKKFFP